MKLPALDELPKPPSGKKGWPWTECSTPPAHTMRDGRPWLRISIVTPSYNQGQFIEETIRSVLLQGYPNLEYVVVDGGSSDGTVEVIEKYSRWVSNWVSEPDSGQADAINKGFGLSSGEIIGWLNSDDILEKKTLQEVAKKWAEAPGCRFLAGDGEIVDVSGDSRLYYVEPKNYSYRDLCEYHKGKYLPQPSVFFCRDTFLELNGLDCDLNYAMDLDLWLRIAKLHRLHYLPICGSRLRFHDACKTYKENRDAMAEVRKVVLRHIDRLPFFERIQIRFGLRTLCAKSLCNGGLQDYFNYNYVGAVAALIRATVMQPAVSVSPTGLRLSGRLLLPSFVKRHLFKRP